MERPKTAAENALSGTATKELYDNDPKTAKNVPSLYGQDGESPVAMESEVFDKDGGVHVQQRRKDENQPKGCWYGFKRGMGSIWMTKQTEDTTYDRELYIKTTLRELIIYVIFLIVICILTFGMTSSNMYYFTSVMMSLFVTTDANPPQGQTFAAIGQMSDFWTFAQGPMLNGLYWETWYNNDTVSNDQLGYIYFENKLLGKARMRQVKVKPNSCKIAKTFSSIIDSCYAPYSSSDEDTEHFGPNNTFQYFTEDQLAGTSYWGNLATYSGGGYIADLSHNKEMSAKIVQYMFDNKWLDRGTRAVFVDFTVYNANINLFCVVTLVVEFPATGGAFPSWQLRTVKLIRYVTSMDYFVMACEIIFCIFIAYYVVEEAIEIRKHRFSYFASFWNCLDIVVILIAICCIAFAIVRENVVSTTLHHLLDDPDEFADFDFLSFAQTQYNNAIAVMVFFAWIKVFKYISFNKTMGQLSSTLSRCAKDVGGFAVMFFIFFFAYAQLGYLLFGTINPDYNTFATASFTLLRLILGDFNFSALQQANRVLGPIYFITFVFFVFFVLLNMFLAIINDTYGEVKAELSMQRNEFEIGDYFKQGYVNMLRKMNLKKDRIVDIQHALHGSDMNSDKQVDYEEWRQQLKKRGYAEAEIEGMFARYDMDGDRSLDTEEQKTMQSELDGQKKAVEKDIATANDRPMTARSDDFNDFDNAGGHHRKRFAGGDGVTLDEFNVMTRRVDRMEHSIGAIVNKIDAVLVKLETMEKMKKQHQDEMRNIMEQINAMDASDSEKQKRMEDVMKIDQTASDERIPSAQPSKRKSKKQTEEV